MSKDVFSIIKRALWGTGKAEADEACFQTMCDHALTALPAEILSELSLSPELYAKWRNAAYQQISFNAYYEHVQSQLPIQVPYVILKGTAVAQYYPSPELRAMGDIDIMPGRADYGKVCEMLLDAGFEEITEADCNGVVRHRSFLKSNIEVEVHEFFPHLSDPKAAKYLDDLIVQNLTPNHILPDPVNGLVILEHISQHLERGIGLRHAIDWMMYVNRCLPDEKWPEFQVMSDRIGLSKLAKVMTRMCEMYLGLPEHSWCADEDPGLCTQLKDYMMMCGNFGSRLDTDSDASERVFTVAKNPKAIFKLLQSYGTRNWKAAQKYAFLKPYAWIYQLLRYVKKGFSRKNSMQQLKEEYAASKKRAELLSELGASQYAQKYVVYKDGEYV